MAIDECGFVCLWVCVFMRKLNGVVVDDGCDGESLSCPT
jgi:hypothetical protein